MARVTEMAQGGGDSFAAVAHKAFDLLSELEEHLNSDEAQAWLRTERGQNFLANVEAVSFGSDPEYRDHIEAKFAVRKAEQEAGCQDFDPFLPWDNTAAA